MYFYGISFKDMNRRYRLERKDFDININKVLRLGYIYEDKNFIGFPADARSVEKDLTVYDLRDEIADFFNSVCLKNDCVIKSNDIKVLSV